MKVTLFEIRLDNPQGVFETGSPVTGHVALNLAKTLKMRSLKVLFEGKAKAFWDVKQGKSKTKYRGHEVYLNNQMTLVSADSQSGQMEHPAGSHVYPFSFRLPATIPSSFEGRRGYVRYVIRATIDRPWKFDEHTKRAFTVIHHYDLNLQPNAVMPVSASDQKEIEGCCCNEGTLYASLQLPKSGFVPGEPIVYDIKVDNRSDNVINIVTLDLIQTVVYTGISDSFLSSGNPKYHEKVESFNLFSQDLNLQKNKDIHIHRATYVPSLPASKLEGCNIINIDYTVQLKVPSGWSSLKLSRQVLIGTKPLMDRTLNLPPPQPLPSAPAALDTVPMATAPPAYEEINVPPPSYEECVFGRIDIRDEEDTEHTGGQTNWAPAYPYYNWSQHSTQTYGGAAPSTAHLNPPDYNQI